ncbi:MAG: DUF5615 family PIN-like protein [Bacteroidia bacterium]
MKILLDECVTKKLKRFITNHQCFTVSDMKWDGLRNGNLMSKSVENDFDLLLTIDKNLQYQQNIGKYNLIVVVFNTGSSKIEVMELFLENFKSQIDSFEKRKAYLIQK